VRRADDCRCRIAAPNSCRKLIDLDVEEFLHRAEIGSLLGAGVGCRGGSQAGERAFERAVGRIAIDFDIIGFAAFGEWRGDPGKRLDYESRAACPGY